MGRDTDSSSGLCASENRTYHFQAEDHQEMEAYVDDLISIFEKRKQQQQKAPWQFIPVMVMMCTLKCRDSVVNHNDLLEFHLCVCVCVV